MRICLVYRTSILQFSLPLNTAILWFGNHHLFSDKNRIYNLIIYE